MSLRVYPQRKEALFKAKETKVSCLCEGVLVLRPKQSSYDEEIASSVSAIALLATTLFLSSDRWSSSGAAAPRIETGGVKQSPTI